MHPPCILLYRVCTVRELKYYTTDNFRSPEEESEDGEPEPEPESEPEPEADRR